MQDNEFQNVPVEKISGWCNQERKHFDPEAMAGLVESIKTFGVIEPIGVVPDNGSFKGLWGQRRFMAAVQAGLSTIPALIQTAPRTEGQAAELRLTENIQREALNPIELAIGFDAVIKSSGCTVTGLAKRLGISAASVSRAIRLRDLPLAIQQQVAHGEIPPSAAYEIAKVEDKTRQSELAMAAAGGDLTRDALSGRLKAARKTAGVGEKAAKVSRATVRLSDNRSVTATACSLSLDTFVEILEDVLARARQARTKGLGLDTFLKVVADQCKR